MRNIAKVLISIAVTLTIGALLLTWVICCPLVAPGFVVGTLSTIIGLACYALLR